VHSFESELRINTVHVLSSIGGGVETEYVLIHNWLVSLISYEALVKTLLEILVLDVPCIMEHMN
jgi:hypothetical protein